MTDARKRAERKKELMKAKFVDPLQVLRVIGASLPIIPDTSQYQMLENGENLMPWNGKTDNLIDRFDGRALLDIITPLRPATQGLSEEEADLESMLNYERYRNVIENTKDGISEKEGLAIAAQEMREYAYGGTAPTQTEIEKERARTKLPERLPAKAQYASIGYKYEEDENNSNQNHPNAQMSKKDEDDEEDTSSSSEDDEKAIPKPFEIKFISEVPSEKEEWLNELASKYDVDDYCRMVRLENKDLAVEQKRLDKIRAQKSTKKLTRREKRRLKERERRRIGNALKRHSPPTYGRRSSPTYGDYRDRRRSRSRDRSYSPRRRRRSSSRDSREPRKRYITEIKIDGKGNPKEEIESYDFHEEPVAGAKSDSRIKEATETAEDDIATVRVIRNPGDRWNFAREIDQKYNQSRYKALFAAKLESVNESEEKKSKSQQD